VSDITSTRTVFIREGTPCPTALSIESEALLPGWRLVNIDRQALTREIERANWSFFYLAGPQTLRRAVKRVLVKQEKQFNSLEITKVVLKRFLGVPFMNVTAHSRHIQQSIYLAPARDFVSGKPVPHRTQPRPSDDGERRHAEETTKQYTVLVSSS
jgi:hypothetical protein